MRLRTTLLLACIGTLLCAAFAQSAAAAAERPAVDIVEVNGVLDPPLTNYLRDAISNANRDGAYLVVIEIDSAGALDVSLAGLVNRITHSRVPIAVWVGPNNAQASSGAALVVAAAHIAGMAPGATIGPLHPADLSIPKGGSRGAALRRDEQSLTGEFRASPVAYMDRRIEANVALSSKSIEFVTPSLAEFLKAIDGQHVHTITGDETLRLKSDEVLVRFHKPGPVRRALHVLSSAALVYLFILFGVGLIAFELFQPGFGIAGVTGGLLVAGAVYGLLVLPVTWWAVALMFSGLGLMTLDVSLNGLGVPTIAGTIAFFFGSLWSFPVGALQPPLWLLITGTITSLIFFVPVMTVVRRQARPIGKAATRALVGQNGEVRSMLNPEGFVWVSGALWRARSEDGSRMRVGEPITVISLSGELLMVTRAPDAV